MTRTEPRPGTMSREDAIERLRSEFLKLTDGETSMCKAAADHGVFCKGFSRYSDSDLRARYWWIVRKRPQITREELESLANRWQLAQQDVSDLPVACDVQTRKHDTCLGWHDFTNEQLAVFFEDLVGSPVTIV